MGNAPNSRSRKGNSSQRRIARWQYPDAGRSGHCRYARKSAATRGTLPDRIRSSRDNAYSKASYSTYDASFPKYTWTIAQRSQLKWRQRFLRLTGSEGWVIWELIKPILAHEGHEADISLALLQQCK